MALRSFVEELADVAPLKPVLAQLMDSIFKLMNEVCRGSLRTSDGKNRLYLFWCAPLPWLVG